jgi:hypothetical protein
MLQLKTIIDCRWTSPSLALLAWAIAAGAAHSQSPDPAERTSPGSGVGVNLDQVVDYSGETPFVDLFKMSRPWIPQQEGRGWGEGPPLQLSADGQEVLRLAPGQYATTLVCCTRGVPAGVYTCFYEGRGQLAFEGDVQVLEERPGRIRVAVEPPGEILLHLRETDPRNPLRRLRFVMPGHEESYERLPFNPAFLEQKSLYRVLRFMDWQQTNDSPIRSWSDRPRMEDPSQAHRGVAIGGMVGAANALQADPWFCMPHMADDDYIRRFAEEVAATLDPKLRMYVEYSNEVWNGIFEQCGYAREQGLKRGLSSDPVQAGLRFYAARAAEIFAIWEEVLGGQGRLVRVISGQGDYPDLTRQILAWGHTAERADMLAIGAYFGGEFGTPRNAARTHELTVDDVIEACRADLGRVRRDIEAHAAIARLNGLTLICYEGGQHLVGMDGAENDEAFTRLLIAANRDPRMKDLYTQHLAEWKAAGGGLYVAYKSVCVPSQWGSWGLLEYEGQNPLEAPKFQALRQFIEQHLSR